MTDPQLSPLGTYITFIRRQNLFTYTIASKEVKQWTFDGGGAISNGMAEFVAQEEMDRMTGYWWSPDEAYLAFTRTDESQVELQTRNEIYADVVRTTEQRYPSAGAKNAVIQLGVLSINKATDTQWIDLGEDKDIYLARVKWFQPSEAHKHLLSFQWQNRTQKHLDLRVVSIGSSEVFAKPTNIVEERCEDGFVNLSADGDLYSFKNGVEFLWMSERSGYNHLYIGQLTNGLASLRNVTPLEDWQVDALHFVDEETGWIYFTGRKNSVLERQLYRVNRETAGAECTVEDLTPESGWHNVIFSLSSKTPLFLHMFSTFSQPLQISLKSIEQDKPKHIAWIEQNVVNADHPLHPYLDNIDTNPSFGTLEAEDGKVLHHRLMKPKDFDATKQYPA